MAALPPSSSQEIARATGLNERYIREWLGGMTAGRIVEHDAAKGTYWLPAEHAASITRAAGPNNLATMAEFVALIGNVEDRVVESFQKGGGVPYSAFPKFQRLMAQLSAQVFDATLVDVVAPMVPGLVDRLQKGIDVADVACAAGARGGHARLARTTARPSAGLPGPDRGRGVDEHDGRAGCSSRGRTGPARRPLLGAGALLGRQGSQAVGARAD